jgi:Ca2+-binding EF-hand superfamily protein
MKKQLFVLPVFLTFVFCILALQAFAQDNGRGKGRDKSEAKHAKEHEKSERKHEKSHDKADKKQANKQESSNHNKSRFRGLDRDNDGRVTRDEWRGDDRSFANQDWNGDGVLSGDEVRPGARRPRDSRSGSDERRRARFTNLDSNNDGVITRNEWHGDSRAFDRLDANRNGVLSRDEFARSGDDRAHNK